MFGKLIGKVLSLPVKIANIPFRVIEVASDVAMGEGPTPKEDRILSKPGQALAEGIEKATEEVLDD